MYWFLLPLLAEWGYLIYIVVRCVNESPPMTKVEMFLTLFIMIGVSIFSIIMSIVSERKSDRESTERKRHRKNPETTDREKDFARRLADVEEQVFLLKSELEEKESALQTAEEKIKILQQYQNRLDEEDIEY